MAINGPSFDQAFAFYGEDSSTLRDEIREDLKRAILTTIGSRPFARSDGFGIEGFVNEPINAETEPLIKFLIANAVGNYNESVSQERQVISSQQLIFIQSRRGELRIDVYFILPSDLNVNPANAIQLISIGPGAV